MLEILKRCFFEFVSDFVIRISDFYIHFKI
jgi:hypothetical protein